jgi:hypothetical protein
MKLPWWITCIAIAGALPVMTQAADTAEQSAAREAARALAAKEIGRPLLLHTESIKSEGDWVFVKAELRGPDNAPFDYKGTKWAGAAEEGMVSRLFVALFKRSGKAWQAVDFRVGPTDVAWESWAAKYHAPAALFK